ncbi:hypothetical protein N752_09710 [Desulforamulus aquiferis]|nr:DUF4405 domain-containing protein [Desulforamulus aquiferis]RYD05363.1 hypothetical protein N752_09710 [Desulforamulus aquiferis]
MDNWPKITQDNFYTKANNKSMDKPTKTLDKTTKYFMIDTALIGLLAASGISGVLLWAGVLPKGTAIRILFKFLHRWGGLGLAILATYHFIEHWDWYKKTGRTLLKDDIKQTKN